MLFDVFADDKILVIEEMVFVTIKLFFEAIIKFVIGIILVGVLLFVPAGTFNYIKGWIFMGVLFITVFVAGIIMMIKNPTLLKGRLYAKEKQKEQGILIKLSGLMFIGGFVVAGLDFRFSWCVLPDWITYAASVVFILSYIMWAEVLRENTYLFRTIKVEEGQNVVDTGLYSKVRHPMYTASIFLFLAIPLILGSIFSFIIFLIYPVIIVSRTLNEEKILEKELDGYKEYMKKVKYRFIPFIW